MGLSLFRRVVERGIFSKLGCGGRMMSNSSIGFDDSRPLLMVPPLLDDSGNAANNFHIVGRRDDETKEKRNGGMSGGGVEVVGMSHGWLALYDRMSHGMHILNPINGHRINLPPLPDPQSGVISRVVVTPDIGRATMIYGGGTKLAFCVPGHSNEWTPAAYDDDDDDDDDDEREYEDVINWESPSLRFDCLTRNPMELEAWNVTDPLSPILNARSSGIGDVARPCRSQHDWELKNKCWRIKYLVLGNHFLGHRPYLVVRHVIPRSLMQMQNQQPSRHPYKTVDFDVYGFSGEGSAGFKYMKASLDDWAIFIGTNHSTVVRAPGVSPNCIYFTDDNRLMHMSRLFECEESGGLDNGIFDYQKNTFSTCGCGNSNCPLDNPNPNLERMDNPAAPIWFHFS